MKKTINPIVAAMNKVDELIATALKGQRNETTIRAELTKLDKKALIDQLMTYQKAEKITVESVVKRIMEDPECAWLTWGEIASKVSIALGSKTTDKCLASYASKKKEWNTVTRRSQADRQAALMSLVAND